MIRHLKQLNRSFAGGEMSPEMYSRIDDGRFGNGVALLRNMICRPQGSVIRRPGSQFIRKVRDNDLGKKVRLLPFSLPNGDTYAIEAGRATTDGREIGYFRFHTQGGTQLYEKPANYIAPANILSFNTSTSTFTTSANHNLTIGDPVTISYSAEHSTGVGISLGVPSSSDRYTLVGSGTTLAHGQPIVIDHDNMPNFLAISGRTLASPTMQRGRIYFVYKPSTAGFPANEFGISETQYGPQLLFNLTFGNPIPTTGFAAAAPFTPVSGGSFGATIYPSTVYYAIVDTPTTFRLALTKANAFALTRVAFSIPGIGTSTSRNAHYAYQPGDLVYWSSPSPGTFSCLRTPWGRIDASEFSSFLDHVDHSPPSSLNYWGRVSGAGGADVRGQSFAATANAGTDRISIGTAHGLDNGEPVIITLSTSPAPGVIASGDVLYVRNVGANDFEVSKTAFGAKVDLTAAGSGISILVAPYYEVPHYYTESELDKLVVAQSNDVISLACAQKPFAELRRTSGSRWERIDVTFTAKSPAPLSFGCRKPGTTAELPYGVVGQAMQVSVSSLGTSATDPCTLQAVSQHVFADVEPVYVYGLSTKGIDDGDYQIHPLTNNTGSQAIRLAYLSSGAGVVATSTGGTGYVQSATNVTDRENTYVVTSIDADGNESFPSNSFTVQNNLFVPGAYNPLAWAAAPNAVQYRVYKKNNSLYGLIGETEELSFVDDSIGPDLGIAPPRPDYSILSSGYVESWDVTRYTLTYSGPQLENGMVILFESNGTLPAELQEGVSYYVINAGSETFQVAAQPYSSTPIQISGLPTGVVFLKAGFFPGTVTYFEGRRCFSGSAGRSQDVWMTASSTESDLSYSLPTVDSNRIFFRVAAREAAAIRHMVPLSHLLILTNTNELRVTPLNDDSLTPTSISVRPQSYVGSDYPQPAVVNNVVVFPAARGGHIRELGFSQETNSYLTGDLSLRAAHLFDDHTISRITYQKAPIPTVWAVSSNGKLLGMTYLPDESIGSWHQHDTDGVFEEIIALPEGTEDVLYVVVLRNAIRYIERISRQRVVDLEDCFYVDCGITYQGAATTTVSGLDHLEGRTVDYLADGIPGTAVVSNGSITLATAAEKVQAGLPIVAQLKTIPLIMQVDQSGGSGRQKNINAVWVRVYESSQFKVGPSFSNLVNSRAPAPGQMLSELVPITIPGSWTDDGQVSIEVTKPVPLNITGLTIEVASGG